MLRIDERRDTRTGEVTLQLEGKLMGEWVEALRRAAEAVLERDSGDLTLDLGGLTFADREGTALLGRLTVRSVRLANCSPFAAAQLRDADIGYKME